MESKEERLLRAIFGKEPQAKSMFIKSITR